MSQVSPSFDTEELMQLALLATERDEIEDAIGHLKSLLAQEPDHAHGLYLMGGLHAQIGLFDRAADEMARACDIDPELWTAHFQLGLLYLRQGDFQEAFDAWEKLAPLGPEDPLFLFQRGLTRFAQGRMTECLEDLDRGIALNTENDALNRDMMAMRAEAEKAMATLGEEPSPDEESDAAGPEGESGRHALLSRYDAGDEG